MQRLFAAAQKHDLHWWTDEMLRRFGVPREADEPTASAAGAR